MACAATGACARPFKDLCEQFEPLRKIADLKYVKPAVKVSPKEGSGVKPQDVAFTIEAKGGSLTVVPDAEGNIAFPFSDKLCAENPNVEMNQPKGSVGLAIHINPAVPAARSFDYKLLEALRAEWDEAISRQSFLWRALAPSSKAYVIQFEPGRAASAEIRLPQGPRKLTADAKGEIRIPFDDAWKAANPTIELSEMPRKIGLAFKG
jgi:hypothetical protein